LSFHIAVEFCRLARLMSCFIHHEGHSYRAGLLVPSVPSVSRWNTIRVILGPYHPCHHHRWHFRVSVTCAISVPSQYLFQKSRAHAHTFSQLLLIHHCTLATGHSYLNVTHLNINLPSVRRAIMKTTVCKKQMPYISKKIVWLVAGTVLDLRRPLLSAFLRYGRSIHSICSLGLYLHPGVGPMFQNNYKYYYLWYR